jgi:hypothetical protein
VESEYSAEKKKPDTFVSGFTFVGYTGLPCDPFRVALVPKLKANLTLFVYSFFDSIPFENEFSMSLNQKKPDTFVSDFTFVGYTGLLNDPRNMCPCTQTQSRTHFVRLCLFPFNSF